MAATLLTGQSKWSGSKDDEGHREYKITHKIKALATDGPFIVMNTPGLPTQGSAWSFDSDSDPWAFCRPNIIVNPIRVEEPNRYWTADQVFSTKPLRRCQDSSIENPLDEPDRIGGSFIKFTREATQNYDGTPIKSSSHEIVRGSAVERDNNKPTVWVEKTLPNLPLSTFAPMIDDLNDAVLWGLPTRTVKLSFVSWERLLYGTCTYYFIVRYEFEIDYSTFDRTIMDMGFKVLMEGGDASDPRDFKIYKDDATQENTRKPVYLDGSGNIWTGSGDPGTILVQFYGESNLLVLGIPAVLD